MNTSVSALALESSDVNFDSILLNILDASPPIADSLVDSTLLDSLTLQIQLIDSLTGMYQHLADSMKSVMNSTRYLNVSNVSDTNSNVSDTLDIETYYKQAESVYLNTIALDDTLPFDSGQLATLYSIAFQCPLKGGEAVFHARSMLALVTDTNYDDASLCSIPGYRSLNVSSPVSDTTQSVQKQDLQVKLYPNPAQNYAILALNQTLSDLQLQVNDAMGRTIIDQEINTVSGYYVINTTTFSSGLYYVSLYSDSNKLFGGTLSVFPK